MDFNNHKLFYVSLIVITKKIPKEDTQKKNRKKSKYYYKKNQQITKEVNERDKIGQKQINCIR